MSRNLKRYFLSVFILCAVYFNLYAQANHALRSVEAREKFDPYPINLSEQLQVFNNEIVKAEYLISLCADVPNNKRPLQVAHYQQCGHVFLILQKINGRDTLSKVFGFYPKSGLPVLFFKTIKSRIKDNSKREYDVDLTKELTAEEFNTVLSRSVFHASHPYHINKFNCYDYAVDIFNSIAGNDSIPTTHIRYPFIFGKGGSPCCVYKDLKKLKESNSIWATYIRFGRFTAPISTGRIIKR